MGGAREVIIITSLVEPQSEIKIATNISEMTFGGGFLLFSNLCCQPQIHWYDTEEM